MTTKAQRAIQQGEDEERRMKCDETLPFRLAEYEVSYADARRLRGEYDALAVDDATRPPVLERWRKAARTAATLANILEHRGLGGRVHIDTQGMMR